MADQVDKDEEKTLAKKNGQAEKEEYYLKVY
jgi:hypothetical protein